MRRSTDGGLYWESPVTIAHRGTRIEGNPRKPETGQHEQTVNNPVAIVDRATGHIHVLYCVNYARCFSMYSVDDGISFSEPIEITPIFEAFRSRYPWNVIATGPGHGIQTQGIQTQGIQTQPGRMIVPVWLAYGKAGDHAPSATGTIYSDDGGKTWQAGQIAVPNQGEFQNPNEAMLASLEDGRVMMVCRNVSKPNRKLITYSPTGIDQWTTPVFHTQLWEPICMASLSAYPSKPRCVLFSNPYSLALNPDGQEIPGGRGKRRNLTIQVSQDDGQTWPIRKVLCEGPSAYSDLAILPDGRILCLYENDRKITVARFNWEWLTSP
jgi:sialidase-1